MIKKGIALSMILMLILGSFVGCSGKSDSSNATKDPVTIKFFTGKVETVDLINNMIEEFNAQNPDIIVEQEFQQEASNAIKIKFASDDIPDITTVVTQDYIDQGKYLDLSNEDQWWSRVNPAIKQMCTDVKTGKQYRIASNMTMAGMFYNKKIFNDLGLKEARTWDEFRDNLMAIKASNPDITPMFVGGKDSWMLGHLIEFMPHGYIKQQHGTTGAKKAFLANDDSKLQFGSPDGPMDSFAKCFLELKDNGLLNDDFLTATYDNQIDAFASGEAAMISQGMWALNSILEKGDGNIEVGFAPYPPIVEGSEPVILSAEDSVYAITADSKHKEEAKRFLDFMFSKENLKKYSETIKSPCAFKDVDADWGVIKTEVVNALDNGVNIGFTNESPSGFSGDDAGRLVQDLYAGKYKSTLEFAKEYKSSWDKAWNATNK